MINNKKHPFLLDEELGAFYLELYIIISPNAVAGT